MLGAATGYLDRGGVGMSDLASGKLYKYARGADLAKVLRGDGYAHLKCSLPRDYDDPYELFLTIAFDEDPELLAFYADLVGDIPQRPTTCFSRYPDVVPMWAHYSDYHTGFVLELDEECVRSEFPRIAFGDVEYRDSADPALNELLEFAHGTAKFRHSAALLKAAVAAAYFTKTTTWSYQHERRLVVSEPEDIVLDGDLQLLRVPGRCVTALIAGLHATDETCAAVRGRADDIGCGYYEMRMGRTSASPYFVDHSGVAHRFEDGRLGPSQLSCNTCLEPIGKGDTCSWCQITDAMRDDAASRDPLRLLEHYGLLEDYLAQRSRAAPPPQG